MKVLSVSVAAYNMEKMIRQNLDSFVSSPVAEDVEVLVVNDGSKDSTAQIVREYEERYPGIVKLIDQQNAGPGSTVNRGIEYASGRYFRIVDADDWVGDGFAAYVEALKKTDADMVLTNFTKVDDKTGQTMPFKMEGIEAGKVLPFAEISGKTMPQMHNTTYRTDILQKNQIRVFNGFYTDVQYLLFPVPYIQTVLYVDCNVYMYRVSLTGQSVSPASMQRNIAMHEDVLFSLTSLYNRVAGENPTAAAYILRRTLKMAGAQMSTLLSFEPSRQRKEDLFSYFERLERECPAIYVQFAKLKTTRVLHLFNGVFYSLVSRMVRKKLGL